MAKLREGSMKYEKSEAVCNKVPDFFPYNQYLISIVRPSSGKNPNSSMVEVYERLDTSGAEAPSRAAQHIRFVDSFPLIERGRALTREDITEKLYRLYHGRNFTRIV